VRLVVMCIVVVAVLVVVMVLAFFLGHMGTAPNPNG